MGLKKGVLRVPTLTKNSRLKVSEDNTRLEWGSVINRHIALKDVTLIQRMPLNRNKIMLETSNGKKVKIEVPTDNKFDVIEWGKLFVWICQDLKDECGFHNYNFSYHLG